MCKGHAELASRSAVEIRQRFGRAESALSSEKKDDYRIKENERNDLENISY